MCLFSIFSIHFQIQLSLAYITPSFLQFNYDYCEKILPSPSPHICLLSVGAFSFLWQTLFSFCVYFLLLPCPFWSGMTRPTRDVGAPWSWLQQLLIPPCLFLTYFKICVLVQSLQSKAKFLLSGPNLLIRAKLWDNYCVETRVTVQ